MDILREHASVKPATHEGLFNLQCKYLSIIVERVERGGGRYGPGKRDNREVSQAFSFCCCCLRGGRGSSSSLVFLNCEARRLVRVLPTPNKGTIRSSCLVTEGFTPSNSATPTPRGIRPERNCKKSPATACAPHTNNFYPCPSDGTANGTEQPR